MENYSVLIVEDDPTFVEVIETIIKEDRRLTIVGKSAGSVEMAVALTQLKPDILILDVEIHGLSGLEVLDVLDSRPQTIVVTANAQYKEEAMGLGVDHFLVKPLQDKRVFTQAIEDCIEQLKAKAT